MLLSERIGPETDIPIGVALCWHNTPAYYAFYYAGIFDTGLVKSHPVESSIWLKIIQ